MRRCNTDPQWNYASFLAVTDYIIDIDVKKRVEELALKADRQDIKTYTRFLTPPEYQYALHYGKNLNVSVMAFGGYPQAERKVVGFGHEEKMGVASFPLMQLEISWAAKGHENIGHRDVLGALLATGISRNYIGDVLIESGKAVAFVINSAGVIITQQLESVGKAAVQVKVAKIEEHLAVLESGNEVKTTVASLRLDAILSAILRQNREAAALLVLRGLVKVNHLPANKKDKSLALGDVISVRGYGRIEIACIGTENRKKRIPIMVMCYGI